MDLIRAARGFRDLGKTLESLDPKQDSYESELNAFADKYVNIYTSRSDKDQLAMHTCETEFFKLIKGAVMKRLKPETGSDGSGMSVTDANNILGPYCVLPSDPDEIVCCNDGMSALLSDQISDKQKAKMAQFFEADANLEAKSAYWPRFKLDHIVKRTFFLPYVAQQGEDIDDAPVTFGSSDATPLGHTVTGPPGTGKTSLFIEIGENFPHVRVYIVQPSAIKASYNGESGSNVEAFFNAANAIQKDRLKKNFGKYKSVVFLVFDEGNSIISNGKASDGSAAGSVTENQLREISTTMQAMMSKYQQTVKTVLVANDINGIPQAMQRRLQSTDAILMGPPSNDEFLKAVIRQFGGTKLNRHIQGTPLEDAFLENLADVVEIVFLAVKESYESVREGTNAQLRRGRKTLTFADVGKITSELNMMFLEEIETYHTYAVTSTIGGNTNAPFLLRLSDECYASVRDFSTEDSSWRLKVEPAPGSETLSASIKSTSLFRSMISLFIDTMSTLPKMGNELIFNSE